MTDGVLGLTYESLPVAVVPAEPPEDADAGLGCEALGTYHAFDFAKYAHRHLAEFQFRFNRRFDMRTILHRLLRSMLQAAPAPEPAIRLAEACA